MNNKIVPILITWDIDPDSWISAESKRRTLNVAADLCHNLGIEGTFFITAETASIYPAELEKLRAQGHEVGCHGLTHGNEENYNLMPEDMQKEYIEKATGLLQDLTGSHVCAFRSPRVKTSATTLKLLSRYGYTTDSSVCSQRVDFVSSNLINFNWLLAPRRSYHPHERNAFKPGNVPIWEVPVSAIMLPFISTTLRVFGLTFMRFLFNLLYTEARHTGKPIVYLAHPTEFGFRTPIGLKDIPEFVRWEYFSPSFIRTHGFRPRNLFYRLNGEPLINATGQLFSYMASFPYVKFFSVSEYARQVLD